MHRHRFLEAITSHVSALLAWREISRSLAVWVVTTLSSNSNVPSGHFFPPSIMLTVLLPFQARPCHRSCLSSSHAYNLGYVTEMYVTRFCWYKPAAAGMFYQSWSALGWCHPRWRPWLPLAFPTSASGAGDPSRKLHTPRQDTGERSRSEIAKDPKRFRPQSLYLVWNLSCL